MAGKVKAVPDGFHTLTPHLVVRDAARAIEFYKQAFGAEEHFRDYSPDGKLMHASLKIGDSMLMLNDEFPSMKVLSPQSVGGSSVTVHIYVEDVDRVFNQAVSAGATVTMPLMDAFWGDRYGHLVDPFGHRWSLATHKEDLSREEVRKRGEAVFAQMAQQAQHGN